MSSALTEGVTIQLGQPQVAKSSTMTFLQNDSSVGTVNYFQSRANARMPHFVTDWVSYPVTNPALGIVVDSTDSVELNNIGGMIGRIFVQIEFPPICNVVTNTTDTGTSLTIVNTGVATVTGLSGGTLSNFIAGEAVTLSGVGGTGFAGEVVSVTSGRPDSITVTAAGRGYSGSTSYTLTGASGGSLTDVSVTTGNAVSTFPSEGGRVLIPRCMTSGAIFFDSVADTVTDATLRNAVKNCVISENQVASAKAVAGITVTDADCGHVRSNGLSNYSMAAYYCRAAPIYLIREVVWHIGSANDEVFPPITTQNIYDYHTFMSSDFNRASDVSLHMSDSAYDLKLLSMGGNNRWIVPLPFPSCHSPSMFVPKFGTSYKFEITWNDWRDTIVNSPTLNANLSCTLKASPVTPTNPAGPQFPETFTPELATYTVTGGRLTYTATGARRCSMLVATSATNAVVPSTPLDNTHFQAWLLVETVRMTPQNENFIRTTFKASRVVCVQRHLPLLSVTPANCDTHFNAVSKRRMTQLVGPVAFLMVRSRMASRAKMNLRMDFSSPRDALLQNSLPSTVLHTTGGQLSAPQSAFHNVSLYLNNSLRFTANEATRIVAYRSSGLREPRGHTDEVLLIPFSSTNPWDGVVSGVFLPDKSLTADMVYNVNPAVFADLQYVGGLPAETSMIVQTDYVAYAVLTIDPSTMTIKLSATS